ncbi:Endonuclease III [Candidatus Gullanella endobia]|uniref:Endonuclease III n=1 Tax=Candidatus Gullanella endobia TaxID=1070130 RepID=A0A143WQD3_9ENTR|nr:endonuclease III [Candidatus Gullanella endobia]CUX95920.1 Endonuclease III [Candidatus Gullanella endobia]
MNKSKRYAILCRLRDKNPYPITELKYCSHFELLIAVILSAKTTNISVNKATKLLFSLANTPEAILSLGIDSVKNCIKSIGLFNSKSENIINTCRLLLEHHKGEVPKNRKELESLPGVGRKTANVILNIAFGQPTIAVDTHVFRVANRTRFVVGKNVAIVEKKLLTVVPKKFKLNFHHWFIWHGRYTCIARNARCTSCLILNLCECKQKYYP